MFSKEETKELIDDLLEEEALLIGGMLTQHQVNDEFIWKLMKNLDQIRDRFLFRIEEMPEESSESGSGLNLTPHPAIEFFLLRLSKQTTRELRR